MKKDFSSTGSRIDRFARHSSSEDGTKSIAGRRVTTTEDQYQQAPDAVKTSIKISRDLKEKTQALARLKQMTWTELIEHALENQLRANAKLINQFTRFHVDEDVPSDGIDGINGIKGIVPSDGINGTNESLEIKDPSNIHYDKVDQE